MLTRDRGYAGTQRHSSLGSGLLYMGVNIILLDRTKRGPQQRIRPSQILSALEERVETCPPANPGVDDATHRVLSQRFAFIAVAELPLIGFDGNGGHYGSLASLPNGGRVRQTPKDRAASIANLLFSLSKRSKKSQRRARSTRQTPAGHPKF